MTCDEIYSELIAEARKALEASGVWDVDGDLDELTDRFLIRSSREVAIAEFKSALDERCRRIPLGHITGIVTFDGMRIVVGSGVFVPREESLPLVEWLANDAQLPAGALVLDLCAGTGAIGLSLARRRPDLQVVCAEIDDVAVAYLRRNIQRAQLHHAQVNHLHIDIFSREFVDRFHGKVHAIVANPPLVPTSAPLRPEWERHHPRRAVYSGADGLDTLRQIVSISRDLLRAEGCIALEHHETQSEELGRILTKHSFRMIRTVADGGGKPRITTGRLAATA